MSTLKKIYRFTAVFTLLLLASNIMLPAVATAVNIYCEMDMEAASSMHNCCEVSEMDHNQRAGNTDECIILSFCEQVVESPQTNTPAIMQYVKSISVAELADEINTLPVETDYPQIYKDQSVSEYHVPPLFLMNSVFLN